MMVAPRPAVEEHQRRPVPHGPVLHDDARTVDVEEQTGSVDVDVHA
jgi:hypothetical protein